MELWHDFFLGELGASAALIGLVFVAVSINLSDIVQTPALASRAFETLLNLIMVLFTVSVALIPMGEFSTWGIVLLILTVLYWGFLLYIQIGILRRLEAPYRRSFITGTLLINQAAALAFFLGALGLIIYGEGGLYLTVTGTFLAYTASFVDAWVLLVEIKR
jgi:modulator of FtsH protease